MKKSQNIELQKLLEKKRNRKAVPNGRPKLNNIPRSWLHQGFTYLDNTQRTFRMLSETTTSVLLVYLLHSILDLSLERYPLWLLSALITHTLFWIFDSNWWANMMFTFPSLRNPGEQATVDYLDFMSRRIKRNKSITGMLLYGSISRGQWHDRSDLDMRFLRRPGFLNGLASVLILYRERLIALLTKQPLDIYIADDVDFLLKMRKDESPVALKKEDKRLDELYPDCKVMNIIKINECNKK